MTLWEHVGSPVPFGGGSFSDDSKVPAGRRFASCHQCLSAVGPSRTPRVFKATDDQRKVSPVPFGGGSFSDKHSA